MKLTTLLMTFFICQSIYSQKSEHQNTVDTSFVIIKGTEIRSFPATNFLDAVNGLFPWVFSQTPNSNDFAFVVDGFTIQDINVISLYDIEEIQFSKGNFQSASFPLARLGTFFIKTKKAIEGKGQVVLNSQSNISFNGTTASLNNGYMYASNYSSIGTAIYNETGNLFANHLSYSIKKKKISFYTSAQFQSSTSPKLVQNLSYANLNYTPYYIDTVGFTRKAIENNFKYFFNFGYEINEHLKTNLKVNYYNSKDIIDTLSIDSAISFTGGIGTKRNQTTTINSNYLNLAASVNWTPFKSLLNKTSIEYFIENIDYDNRYSYSDTFYAPNPYFNTRNVTTKNSIIKFSNDLNYQVTQSKTFQLNTSLNLSFYHFNNDYSDTVNSSIGYSKSKSYYDLKLTTLNPSIDFKVSKFLSGYFGYPFFLSDIKSELNKTSIVNPFYGLNVDLKQLMKWNKKINSLCLNFNYSDMPIGQLPDYHLGSIISPDQLTTKSIYSTHFDYYTRKSNARKNKLFSIQLVYHSLNEKMLLGVEWISQLKDKFFPYQIPFGQIYIIGKELNRGLSLFAQTNLINTPKLMWKFRGNILFPKTEFVKDRSNPPSVYDEQPMSYSLQCGIQNNIHIKHFTIQANINIGLDKKYYEIQYSSGFGKLIERKLDEIGLSYFTVSYDFSNSKNKLLSNLALTMQAKNIITAKTFSDYYQLNKYVGLNLSYKF